MRRGTTPTNEFEVNVDLRGTTVWLTYTQNERIVVDCTNDRLTITEASIKCTLTQEETLALTEGIVEIQARYITEEGVADASDIIKVPVGKILKGGVITYV